MIEMLQQEGLTDYFARAYRIAAITHARIEDWQSAAFWSNKGYELRFIENPHSQSTMEMSGLTKTFVRNRDKQMNKQASSAAIVS